MDPATWIGKTIDGRYLVEAVIGRGGMGIVLRAKQTFTGVHVALKLLHRELQLDPEIQARFLAEAKAPNQIGHRSIVSVVDAGRTPDGILYIAMELLVGRSLRTSLQRGELSPELQKRVMLDLLEALGHAHARGFIHRDLKPDNVFLCGPQNDVKLLDFGIAKVLDDARKTATGALLGTPAYMAPEQLANAAAVDSRADLWAIGVIAYEMMTGRLPIPGRNANEVLVALASAEPTPIRAYLPNVSPAVEQFFARCLARDPRMRFGAASEVAQALAPLSFAPPQASPTGTMATAATGYPAATAASVAPVAPLAPSMVATHVPIAPAYAAPPQAPVGQPSRSRALWIVAGGAVLLILVGIAIAVSGRKAPAVPADAALPPDAETVERDATVIVTEPKTPTTCEERCAWLDKECDLRGATCESDCVNRPVAFGECYDRARTSCREGATCAFAVTCNKPPSGTLSCGEAASCQLKCNTLECLCTCAARLKPQFALELGRWNACYTRAVAAGCLAQDLACIGKACSAEGIACDNAE